jgi:acetyl-CoA carboxylase carboxyltransferase component
VTADQLVIDEDRGDYRDPAIRLSRLLGANSVVPLYESGDSCVLSVKGSIDGVKVLAYSTDARVMGGSMTAGRCRRIADAIRQARRTTVLFAEPGIFQPARSGFGPERDLRILLPESARRAYDVRPLVREILDHEDEDEPFLELQARWAPNLVVGLGRLYRGTRTHGRWRGSRPSRQHPTLRE